MAEIRIACGRATAYTDTLGRVWAADNSFVSGSTFTSSNSIANTLNQPIFQSERYATGLEFSYLISIPNGIYTLKLGFAEVFFTSSGQRVCNVFAQGIQVLSNYDIFFDSGGANTAVVKSFPITVADGIANLRLVSVVENAKISNIEILSVDAIYFAAPLMLMAC